MTSFVENNLFWNIKNFVYVIFVNIDWLKGMSIFDGITCALVAKEDSLFDMFLLSMFDYYTKNPRYH